MEQTKFAGQTVRQTVELYKTTFDNTFNATVMLQEQAEKMVAMYLDQAPLIPAEGKKVVNDWLKAYKKGRTDFKAAADENYKKVEEFFAGFDKAKKA